MEATVVTTTAGPIEVADIGSGPAVIIVHGMPGDWSQAAAIGQVLADRHRVLLVSRPGYGRTPLATGPTWHQSAAAYASLLDCLGIDRATIIGISGGGPSSFAFAARERDRCDGLILCCAVNPDVRAIPMALRVFHALPGVREALHRIVRRRQLKALEDPDAVLLRAMEEANQVERERVEADPVALQWLLDFVRHNARVTEDMRPFRHDLRQLVRHQRRGAPLTWPEGPDVPALIMHGTADPVVGLEHAQRFADLIPGARTTVYEGAGHGFLFTFRSETMLALQTFLDAAAAA